MALHAVGRYIYQVLLSTYPESDPVALSLIDPLPAWAACMQIASCVSGFWGYLHTLLSWTPELLPPSVIFPLGLHGIQPESVQLRIIKSHQGFDLTIWFFFTWHVPRLLVLWLKRCMQIQHLLSLNIYMSPRKHRVYIFLKRYSFVRFNFAIAWFLKCASQPVPG